MGKHTRIEPDESTCDPTPDAGEDVDALLGRAITLLKRLATAVESVVTDGGGTSTLVRESAALARAIVSVCGELRAREKQAALTVRKLSPQLVRAYLRSLDADERTRMFIETEPADGLLG